MPLKLPVSRPGQRRPTLGVWRFPFTTPNGRSRGGKNGRRQGTEGIWAVLVLQLIRPRSVSTPRSCPCQSLPFLQQQTTQRQMEKLQLTNGFGDANAPREWGRSLCMGQGALGTPQISESEGSQPRPSSGCLTTSPRFFVLQQH